MHPLFMQLYEVYISLLCLLRWLTILFFSWIEFVTTTIISEMPTKSIKRQNIYLYICKRSYNIMLLLSTTMHRKSNNNSKYNLKHIIQCNISYSEIALATPLLEENYT